MFDYLASGRPIIVAGRVESARLVDKIKAGFIVEAEDPNQLAEAVRMVSKLSAVERDLIGARGADYVRSHYDRKIHAEDMLLILKSVTVVSD